jgi:hypothetical protein
MKIPGAFLLIVLSFFTVAFGQDEARAVWQTTNFDITANLPQTDRSLNVVALLSATNVGRGTGTTFTFRIAQKAAIKSVNVGGATATYRSVSETVGNLQRVTVTLPGSVAGGGSTQISINYSLPVDSNTGLAAVSAMGSQFLPLSFWYPTPNTPFSVRGADTAPVKIMVNATGVLSSGVEKSTVSASTLFEQPLASQPFFVQGDWDKLDGTADAKMITAYLPRGAGVDEKKQAEALINLASAARGFYSNLLGAGPDVPIRLVAVRRGAGFAEGGTILLETGAFRRAKTDATTALLIAESVARLWIGGQTPVRGDGGGTLRDGLVRFLATQFVEKQFGASAARAEMLRERLAYSTVAKKDGPLARMTMLDAAYFNSVPNKGAMVWRLVENNLGRDAFFSTLRDQLQTGRTGSTGITLAGLRAALATRGGERTKSLLDQQLDQVTDLDLLVGLPQQRGADWVAALRNLGATDAITSVRATAANGQQTSVDVVVPARNFGEAVFKNAAKPVRVEIDPEKLYPQLDYSNDISPKTRDAQEAMGEATRQFSAQDYAKAETIAREALSVAPDLQEARILLARALLAQNRIDDAEKLFRAAIDDVLPTPGAMAWGNIGLGEVSLRRNQAAEAAKRFNDAVRADAEYASSLSARANRIKAETAANSVQVDPAVKTFVSQLDQAILSGKRPELESKIIPGELVRFINGLIGTQPEIWQTRVLRSEPLDANFVSVDVSLETKELGNQRAGTAVLTLMKTGNGYKLAAIDLFEVN